MRPEAIKFGLIGLTIIAFIHLTFFTPNPTSPEYPKSFVACMHRWLNIPLLIQPYEYFFRLGCGVAAIGITCIVTATMWAVITVGSKGLN